MLAPLATRRSSPFLFFFFLSPIARCPSIAPPRLYVAFLAARGFAIGFAAECGRKPGGCCCNAIRGHMSLGQLCRDRRLGFRQGAGKKAPPPTPGRRQSVCLSVDLLTRGPEATGADKLTRRSLCAPFVRKSFAMLQVSPTMLQTGTCQKPAPASSVCSPPVPGSFPSHAPKEPPVRGVLALGSRPHWQDAKLSPPGGT